VLDDRAAHRVGGEAGTRREALAAAQPAEVIVLDADLAGGLEALAARLAALDTPSLLALGRAVGKALWETSDDLLEPITDVVQAALVDRWNRDAR
jgi:hypothetical protein